TAVRSMSAASAAGSTHYCIIEQGRVDAVLQASTRDRGAIIEEAAGISRFKAKKIETLRKLEHTAENLTRLRDILGEVEARLRRVRLDAEKARRFQEHSGRLRELRVGLGLREFHDQTGKLTAESDRLEALRTEMSAAQMQVAVWEDEAKQLEASAAQADAEVAAAHEGLSEVRRRIATFHERQANESAKAIDVEAETAAARRRAIELEQMVRTLAESADRARGEVGQAEAEAGERRARVDELDAAAAAIETE